MLRNVLHSKLPIEMYHFTGELEDKELRAELEASYDLKLVEVSGKRPNGKSWSEILFFSSSDLVSADGRYQEFRLPSYSIHRVRLHG
jgi:hypothetical protein